MSEQKDEFREAASGFAKFEQAGDEVTGTYVGQVAIPAKGIYPEQIGYQLLVEGNEVIAAFNLSKKWVHSAMKGAKIGQRVKFLFDSWFETDAYKKELERVGGKTEDCKISRAKTIKVFLGSMDQEYINGFDVSKAIEDPKFD
jgi:hypothetical protein